MNYDDEVKRNSVEHDVHLLSAGTYFGWHCQTCGKTSRHLLPYHRAARNARAHELKAIRAERKAG